MGRDRDAHMRVHLRELISGLILTRRSLLRPAGWVIAAAAFPAGAVMAAQPISPVMARLSNYMGEARRHAPRASMLYKRCARNDDRGAAAPRELACICSSQAKY